MTQAIALTGQWEGLRAFPRASRPPSTEYHRRRLHIALDRVEGLYESMAARAALLAAGMERLNGLRAGMIDQLDFIDGDADLEPSLGGSELRAHECQSFAAATMPLDCGVFVDLEDDCEDEGGQCDDEGADESDDDGADTEPSLSILMTTAADQSGSRWTGGCDTLDREDDGDAEPPYGGIHMWSAGVEEAGVR